LSGIDAVKRIVETEAKARKIVEDSKVRAQDVLQKASKDIEAARGAILEQAQRQREEILSQAKVEAEADAGRLDVDTDQTLANYQKAFQGRRDDAVEKTVQLILRG
jgi:vacuolar-type H+-ATPase subunit H